MRFRGWVPVIVLAVLLTACSTAVPGTSGPATDTPVADLPFAGPARLLAERAGVLRTRDACAVHDVAAAERVAGAVAFVIRPRGGFDGCEVVLEDGGALAYLSVEVGAVRPGGGPPAEVDGRAFPRVAPAADAAERVECGYARTDGLGTGLVVRGEVVDAEGAGDAAASCRLAADYLTTILPRLDTPPARAAAGTAPAFALAGLDPCAALALAVPRAAGAAVDGPRTCTADGVAVTVDLRRFEVDVPGAATLLDGGRIEAVDETADACTVTRQASDTTLLAPSLPYLYRETVALTAADCAAAGELLTAALAAVGEPAVPAPGALVLGSLDGNPVADDVGAPFDPCATIGWADFPAATRPPGVDPRPFPAPVEAADRFRVGCDYTSDAVAAVVTWGTEPGPGGTTTFGDRPGREDRREGACSSELDLAVGVAGVITVVRSSGIDPCAVNRAVLDALAPRAN